MDLSGLRTNVIGFHRDPVMIELQQITGNLSDRVTQRARHCWAVKIRTGEYRVVPRTRGFVQHRGKAKRRVRFWLEGGRVLISCVNYHDGAPCLANYHKAVCCHSVAAYRVFLRSVEKEQRRAA